MTYFNQLSPQEFSPLKYNPFVVTSKPLTDDWKRWIAENKLLGADDDSLVQTLVQHGIDANAARRELQIVRSHPYFQAGRNFTDALKKLESHANISIKLAELSPKQQQIERREKLTQQEFLENYYATSTPVILTGMMENWPALSLWSPEYLKANYGEVEIEVQTGRNSDPIHEINVDLHRTKFLMRDYVDLIVNSDPTNDFYMVANNRNIEREGMKSLVDQIEFFPEYLDPHNTEGNFFFWLGPAGTITPLHQDTANIFMAQVYGRKHWKMIPPYYNHLIYNYRGVFSEVNLDNPDYDRHPLFKQVKTIDVVVEPGEVIFIPVAWWHYVRSLDISISLSFTNFIFPNQYQWNFPDIRR
ncbi:cupin-like domain-containing protein [Tumidithrix helvetica PCC 7403]|uniref:cupin-like domain-containing protein n=1 Tax=Tumidithrix helvetica TaxID=3457545 RepID=UPI003C84AADE